jgi:putative spermidine/putrescine transport system permease protein
VSAAGPTSAGHVAGSAGAGGLGIDAVYGGFLVPGLALLVIGYALPVVQVLWISVAEPSLGFTNYAAMIASPMVRHVVWTTARICLMTTALTVLVGYIVAYVLTHVSDRARRLLLLCVLVPFWLSVLARAFAWVMLLRSNGIINDVLIEIGAVDQPLDMMRNEFGVMVGMIHYMLPYAILPLLANLQGIDQRLIAAARGLGAGPSAAFCKIFLPLSVPGIAGAATLVFVFSLGFYVTPAILGGGKTLMIAEMIALNILTDIRWGLAAALASSLLVAVLLTLAIMSRAVGTRRLFGLP